MSSTIYIFTYITAAGRTQSFRCTADSEAEARKLWAGERKLWRKITGAAVQLRTIHSEVVA